MKPGAIHLTKRIMLLPMVRPRVPLWVVLPAWLVAWYVGDQTGLLRTVLQELPLGARLELWQPPFTTSPAAPSGTTFSAV